MITTHEFNSENRNYSLDYSLLSREIITQLRKNLSQADLSNQLGFTFNQVGKWESGATTIHWKDFTKICDALELPWVKHYNETFALHQDMTIENSPVFESLSRFFGYSNLNDMVKRLHKSKSSVSRLINNQVAINFSDVLQVMDIRPFVLTTWLSKFLNISSLDSFKTKYEIEITLYKGLLTYPEAALVNCCLHLDAYLSLNEHSNDWISKKIGINEQDVEKALNHLINLGMAYKIGSKYKSIQHDITSLRLPEFRKVIQFVSEWTTNMYNSRQSFTPNYENPSISALRLYPMSSDAAKKIIDALVIYHHQVAEIVRNDVGPKDHVRAILIHCLDMGISQNVSKSDTSKP